MPCPVLTAVSVARAKRHDDASGQALGDAVLTVMMIVGCVQRAACGAEERGAAVIGTTPVARARESVAEFLKSLGLRWCGLSGWT